jgi:pheromone shutdown-related protein TraB
MRDPEIEGPLAPPAARDSSDVVLVRVGDREIFLVGTAHVSRESADLARQLIESEEPDCVCVELDERRYEALRSEQKFESLDLREVLRRKQLSTLIFNLVLASYQKQLGGQLGVQPGAELLAAARAAEAQGARVELCDRDVRATLRRAWGSLSLWQKFQLIGAMLASLFDSPEMSEEDLRELRQQDVVTKLMDELGVEFPSLKRVLIDERDLYLAEKIRVAGGRRVVAVLGAGHLPGVKRTLEGGEPVDLETLDELPPPSAVVRWIGWGVPVVILGAIALIGVREGFSEAWDNARYWILANGLPAMLGSAIAFGHPVTLAGAFIAAPITSLTPVIGAGYVAAFVQTYLRPPLVRELHSVMTDMRSARMWWSNRLLRIFLVFFLTNLGSTIGTFVGGAEILANLRR